jgi:hypothetical protein
VRCEARAVGSSGFSRLFATNEKPERFTTNQVFENLQSQPIADTKFDTSKQTCQIKKPGQLNVLRTD